MATSSGVGPHTAWLSVSGGTFLIERGTADLQTQQSSTFSADLPLYLPGALDALALIGDNSASVIVMTRGLQGALVTGEIKTVEIDYIAGMIHVDGVDQSAGLHENKSSETWTNQPGSQIAQQLAGRVGLGFSGDASQLLAGKQVQIDYRRISDNISFAAIIHKLAELDGARWWVQNGTLYYQSQNSPAGAFTLNYDYDPNAGGPVKADFLNLKVRRNVTAGKTVNVTVNSWNPKQKQANTHTATVGGNGGPLNYNYHVPNLFMDHVQQYAIAKANEAARHEITIEAECVGDPTITLAMGLQLNGTGYFDQAYTMDHIHHEFGIGGHTMTITARAGLGGRAT